jgi:hypothetical protein
MLLLTLSDVGLHLLRHSPPCDAVGALAGGSECMRGSGKMLGGAKRGEVKFSIFRFLREDCRTATDMPQCIMAPYVLIPSSSVSLLLASVIAIRSKSYIKTKITFRDRRPI